MLLKIFFGLSLSFMSFPIIAQDLGPAREPKSTDYTKYVHEMTPAEIDMAINGYPRCKLSTATTDFPFDIDFVIANGEEGKLFFLELTNAKTKRIKVLYLEEVGAIPGGYQIKADQRTLGFGWLAKAAVTQLNGKGYDVHVTELSSKWQIGYSKTNLHGFCQ